MRDALAALRELYRICAAMDAEIQAERPSEEEYQAAMAAARAVIEEASRAS